VNRRDEIIKAGKGNEPAREAGDIVREYFGGGMDSAVMLSFLGRDTKFMLRVKQAASLKAGNEAALSEMSAASIFQACALAGVMNLSSAEHPGYEMPRGEFFRRAAASAAAAYFLARYNGFNNPEHAYLAGMIMDAGKLIMDPFVLEEENAIAQLVASGDMSFTEAEREALGIDHSELSCIMYEALKFPPALLAACMYHHDPDKCNNAETAHLADICHVADAAAMKAGIGTGREGLDYRLSERALKRLRVSGGVMEAMMAEMAVEIRAVSGIR